MRIQEYGLDMVSYFFTKSFQKTALSEPLTTYGVAAITAVKSTAAYPSTYRMHDYNHTRATATKLS